MKLDNIVHSSDIDHTKPSPQSYWQLNTGHEGEYILIKAFLDEYEAVPIKKIIGYPLVVTIEKHEHELIRQLKAELVTQCFSEDVVDAVSDTLGRLLNK